MRSQQSFWAACMGFRLVSVLLLSAQGLFAQHLDDFVSRSVIEERQVLPYQPLREADVLWEKRIWRVIDTREKLNHPFVSPNAPLFSILRDAIEAGELTAYSTEDDKFSKALSVDEVLSKLDKTDTIPTFDVETGDEEVRIITNTTNWEDVKRFRLKEAWYFDSKTSTLQVRILGIAPLLDVKDENGDFRYEMPLFWIHYPSAREILAQQRVSLHADNLAATTTWEDLFERRQFASLISKENNVQDLRLEDSYSGLDVAMQGQKIAAGIFNFEHDLWSY